MVTKQNITTVSDSKLIRTLFPYTIFLMHQEREVLKVYARKERLDLRRSPRKKFKFRGSEMPFPAFSFKYEEKDNI